MTRIYRGSRRNGGTKVTVQPEGEVRVIPLRHYVRHSPDGFEWGYGGSGPAELARCILIDHFGLTEEQVNDERGEHLPVSYQDFKFDVIARLPRDGTWAITAAEIDAWASKWASRR